MNLTGNDVSPFIMIARAVCIHTQQAAQRNEVAERPKQVMISPLFIGDITVHGRIATFLKVIVCGERK
jgi:hypothetical protein